MSDDIFDFMPANAESVTRWKEPTSAETAEWIRQTQFVLSRELCAYLRWPMPQLTLEQKWLRESQFRYTGNLTIMQQGSIVLDFTEDCVLQENSR
jgi:hypothetical protein